MSKRENDANNAFRPSDSPLTEYEKDQIAVRKNLERLRAERLAREAEQKAAGDHEPPPTTKDHPR
jgi:U3 small nucleolar ribonucleoprotein component